MAFFSSQIYRGTPNKLYIDLIIKPNSKSNKIKGTLGNK